MADPLAETYVHKDMNEANAECGVRPLEQQKVYCPRCDRPVILHCDNCKLAVTGCLCSEVERFGSSVAFERAIERWGEDEAKKRFQESGFWIPPESN